MSKFWYKFCCYIISNRVKINISPQRQSLTYNVFLTALEVIAGFFFNRAISLINLDYMDVTTYD